jgi:hypothetical protein
MLQSYNNIISKSRLLVFEIIYNHLIMINLFKNYLIKKEKICTCHEIINNPIYIKINSNKICPIHKFSFKSKLCDNYHFFNNRYYYIYNFIMPIISRILPNFKIDTLFDLFHREIYMILAYWELKHRSYYTNIYNISEDYNHIRYEKYLNRYVYRADIDTIDFKSIFIDKLLNLNYKDHISILSYMDLSNVNIDYTYIRHNSI